MDLWDVAGAWSLLSVVTASVVCVLLKGGHGEDISAPELDVPHVGHPPVTGPVASPPVPQPRQASPSLQSL